MSLDLNKLEKVRAVGNGAVQARCPACAEAGQDRKGEHLRIQPDGKFGCCVFPKDHLHRKRIFALAGDSQPRIIRGSSATGENFHSNQGFCIGTLGTAKTKSIENPESTIGTLGTTLNPYTYENKLHKKLIGFGQGVPSVPSSERMPYLLPSGNVIIPFDCPPKYRWWAGGQSRSETQAELKALRQKSST